MVHCGDSVKNKCCDIDMYCPVHFDKFMNIPTPSISNINEIFNALISNQNVRCTDKQNKNEFRAFVCNISFDATETEVKNVFERVVHVENFNIVNKRNSRNQIVKRFAFVEVGSEQNLKHLITMTNGVFLYNRPLSVRINTTSHNY